MSAVLVDYSRDLLLASIRDELRGSGDVLPAMRRIAKAADVPYAKLYALKYRPGADVDGSVMLKLFLYREKALARQAERYRAARDATDTSHWLAGPLSRLAASIAGEADRPQAPD